MFKNLTNKLSNIFRKITNKGHLTDKNIKNILKEVKIALLEADVALKVVYNFIERVKLKAIGTEINKYFNPQQAFIKIVRDEIIYELGITHKTLNLSGKSTEVILVVGQQGVGKTTSVVKIGKYLQDKHKKKILVVSIDVYRPAAIKQLETLADMAKVDFFPSNLNQDPLIIIHNALNQAKLKLYDLLIVDTAGRLHIDKDMMNEISQVNKFLNPKEILLVVDAMTGQDIINIITNFKKYLNLTGIILTKLDSDTRGGVALSIRHLTEIPIKLIGTGEKLDTLELFYPERLADRILGMGDLLSLIEEIEHKIDNDYKTKLKTKLKQKAKFNLNDFLHYLQQIKKIGGLSHIINKLPIINQLSNSFISNIDDNFLCKMEIIINSMTDQEKINPKIIKGSRKKRIALGSGTKVQEINKLLKYFLDLQNMLKQINNNSMKQLLNNFINMKNQNLFK